MFAVIESKVLSVLRRLFHVRNILSKVNSLCPIMGFPSIHFEVKGMRYEFHLVKKVTNRNYILSKVQQTYNHIDSIGISDFCLVQTRQASMRCCPLEQLNCINCMHCINSSSLPKKRGDNGISMSALSC